VQALGDRPLGHRIPGQRQDDAVTTRVIVPGTVRVTVCRGVAGGLARHVERQHGARVHRRRYGRGRVRDAQPPQRAGDHPGRHRGVAIPCRAGQQVADQRPAPPGVLRAGRLVQHLASEPVGLIGPDLRQRQQQPGIFAQLLCRTGA
jgi:hypothetical protein